MGMETGEEGGGEGVDRRVKEEDQAMRIIEKLKETKTGRRGETASL